MLHKSFRNKTGHKANHDSLSLPAGPLWSVGGFGRVSVWMGLLAAAQLAVPAASYYLDSSHGKDASSGATPASAWRTLDKVNHTTFQPGDSILLKCGCRWTGLLNPKGSGTAVHPIVIDVFGSGPKPLIEGNGATGNGVVYLFNQQYWEINNLEITDDAPREGDRRGVYLSASNYPGTAVTHLYVRHCYIHHIKGLVHETSNAAKRTGGVLVETVDNRLVPTRFDDVRIEDCEIATVDNVGIALNNRAGTGDYPGTPEWEARKFTRVVIRGNTIHDVAKNAIIVRLTDETGLIERNRCFETAVRARSGNTIFSRSCRGTVFQYNEGYLNRATGADGSLYDADLQSPGCIFQFSYSHDNNQGLYWQCTAPQDSNIIVRYNISQNDKGSIFCLNYPGASTYLYNNTVFIGSNVPPVIIDERRRGAKSYYFYNNIFYNLSPRATYHFFDGDRHFSHNLFYGCHPQAEPDDPHKLTCSPGLVHPGSGAGLDRLEGYFLKFGSPCIDSGLSIPGACKHDFWGNALPDNKSANRGAFGGAGTSGLTERNLTSRK